MNKLRKQFEEETGKNTTFDFHGAELWSDEYIDWLEDKLTWRSVDDAMPNDGEHILIKTSNFLDDMIFHEHLDIDWFCRHVKKWLPIPERI